MEKSKCKTYLKIAFDFDRQTNIEMLKNGILECAPEELGIHNKNEVENELKKICKTAVWRRHHFVVGENTEFDIDINNMIRKTLKELWGHEEFLKDLQSKYGVELCLELVPYIAGKSSTPTQILSLDNDIIEFLYKSGTSMDLDYYII